MSNLDGILSHLSGDHRADLKQLILKFPEIFKDTPGRTSLIEHEVDVGNSPPISQAPYQLTQKKEN